MKIQNCKAQRVQPKSTKLLPIHPSLEGSDYICLDRRFAKKNFRSEAFYGTLPTGKHEGRSRICSGTPHSCRFCWTRDFPRVSNILNYFIITILADCGISINCEPIFTPLEVLSSSLAALLQFRAQKMSSLFVHCLDCYCWCCCFFYSEI